MTEVIAFDTTAELTAQAAKDVAQILKAAIEKNGNAWLVITGGTLGIQILGDIAQQGLDVSKLNVIAGDERFVALENADRNEWQALGAWPEINQSNFHRFPAPGLSLSESAAEFDEKLTSLFGAIDSAEPVFDVLLLGMGPDGHVASLFPGKFHEVAWVVSEHDSPKPPSQRLSLSYQALNRSSNVLFLASGQAKAEVARCAIADSNCDLPAAKVKGQKMTRWYVDSEISREL